MCHEVELSQGSNTPSLTETPKWVVGEKREDRRGMKDRGEGGHVEDR